MTEQAPPQQAPPQQGPPQQALQTGRWSHGLCGCFDNLGVCIVAYFVPCVTFGQTRQRLTGDGCVLYGLLYLVPFLNCFLEVQQRGKIREIRGIPGGTVGDCCVIWCCTCCAIIQEEQEAIEIQNEMTMTRGADVIVTHAVPNTVVIGGANPTMYPPAPQPQYNMPPQYNNPQYNNPQYNTPQYNMPPQQYDPSAPPPQDFNVPAGMEKGGLEKSDMDRV